MQHLSHVTLVTLVMWHVTHIISLSRDQQDTGLTTYFFVISGLTIDIGFEFESKPRETINIFLEYPGHEQLKLFVLTFKLFYLSQLWCFAGKQCLANNIGIKMCLRKYWLRIFVLTPGHVSAPLKAPSDSGVFSDVSSSEAWELC